MKRAALVFGAVSLLLLADGLWMQATHYHPGDQNTFFGNQRLILSDGQVILISAGLLMLATGVMWLVAARRSRGAGCQARRPPGSRPRSNRSVSKA